MVILERLVQSIVPGKWVELEALDKRFDAVEARYGFPPKQRFQCIGGSLPMETLVIERIWPSLAVSEDAYTRLMMDPEWQQLSVETIAIIKKNVRELYRVLS
mgnify:CR=1 FL=1